MAFFILTVVALWLEDSAQFWQSLGSLQLVVRREQSQFCYKAMKKSALRTIPVIITDRSRQATPIFHIPTKLGVTKTLGVTMMTPPHTDTAHSDLVEEQTQASKNIEQQNQAIKDVGQNIPY
jgi:hypothetical protein